MTSLSGTPSTGVANQLGNSGTSSYTLTKPVLGTAGSNTLAYPGLAPVTTQVAVGNTVDLVAISVTDFNIFRLRVVDAFNTLENKVRELTSLTDDLTC